MFLNIRGPFDLAHTLDSGQAFRWRLEGDCYYGVVGGNVFQVRQVSGGLEFASAPQPPEETAPLLPSYFRLDDDLPAIYRRIGRDRRVAGALRRYRGLRLIRQDPWECLVSFVISVYSNIPRIARHIEHLSRAYGDSIRLGDYLRHTFPSAARLAEVGERDLREMGLGFRARFLARLAGDIARGGMDLLALRALPYAEAKAAILRLPGVGEKVADCVLAFSLDKLEAFPVDVWVRRAVLEWYFPGEKATDRVLRLWAADYFGPYAGYAQQYLFHERRLEGRAAGSQRKPAATEARS